jgi:predicted ATPase
LEAFLRSIYLFAEEQKVQIIASTHSYELLQALGRVMADEEGRENQFTLLRTERRGKETFIERIDGSAYRAAVDQGFEVR